MNDKGFTFVEILAVIAIIGILSGIAIIGVSRYRESAKNKDYEALARSAYNGTEEYAMANPYKDKVSLEKLADGNFISNRVDPATKNSDCSGSVEIIESSGSSGKLDSGVYKVHLCCTNYKKTYTYPEGTVTDLEDEDYCDYVEEEEEELVIPTPQPGETAYTITYNLNGGTVSGNPDKYAESMLPLTIKNPTRSGYTFTGWTGSNGTTPQKTVTLPKGTINDKSYTANWTKNQQEIKPSCTISISNGTKGDNDWFRSDVTITMNVTPSDTPTKGLATSKNSTNGKTSITISSDGIKTYYGYVKNSVGTGTCSIIVKRDVTKPTCGTASGASKTWTKDNRTIKQACSDSTSKCVKASYNTTYKSNTKTASETIKDNAGNTRSCTYNVYVDKTAPTAEFCKSTSNSSKKPCLLGPYCIKIYYSDNFALGMRKNLKEYWYGENKTWPDYTTRDDEIAVGHHQSTLKITNVTITDKAGNSKTYSNKSYSSLPWCS